MFSYNVLEKCCRRSQQYVNINNIPLIVSESDLKKIIAMWLNPRVQETPPDRVVPVAAVWSHLHWFPSMTGRCRAALLCSQDHILYVWKALGPALPAAGWYGTETMVSALQTQSLREESPGGVRRAEAAHSRTKARKCRSLRSWGTRVFEAAHPMPCHLSSCLPVSFPLPEPQSDLCSHRRGLEGCPSGAKPCLQYVLSWDSHDITRLKGKLFSSSSIFSPTPG